METFELKELDSQMGYCIDFHHFLDLFYGCPEIRSYVTNFRLFNFFFS